MGRDAAPGEHSGEKHNSSSFRGALRAEESLLCWALGKEGFLTSFGMTTKGARLEA
jgi:hypothetical protein